ncbi:hypothetical protein [Haloarcula sp. S1AR25-4]|nr:hypothetical protein [Halomicroarcula sp. S1AR25-4]
MSDRVIEDVDQCETEGCTNFRYPGESRCLGCYRKRTRRSA